MMRSFIVALVALALPSCASAPTPAVPVAGGSADDAVAGEVDPREPCALLDPEEVADAIGYAVAGENEVPSRPDQNGREVMLCRYDTTEPFRSVIVYPERDVSKAEFDRRMQRDPINTEEIEGVGDAAFLHAGVGLSVLVDDVVFNAGVQDFTDVEEAGDALIDLAKVAVDKLRP